MWHSLTSPVASKHCISCNHANYLTTDNNHWSHIKSSMTTTHTLEWTLEGLSFVSYLRMLVLQVHTFTASYIASVIFLEVCFSNCRTFFSNRQVDSWFTNSLVNHLIINILQSEKNPWKLCGQVAKLTVRYVHFTK